MGGLWQTRKIQGCSNLAPYSNKRLLCKVTMSSSFYNFMTVAKNKNSTDVRKLTVKYTWLTINGEEILVDPTGIGQFSFLIGHKHNNNNDKNNNNKTTSWIVYRRQVTCRTEVQSSDHHLGNKELFYYYLRKINKWEYSSESDVGW